VERESGVAGRADGAVRTVDLWGVPLMTGVASKAGSLPVLPLVRVLAALGLRVA